jgi:transcriptional regulator with XRE-family HTH domain
MPQADLNRPFADLPFANYLDRAMEDKKMSPKKIAEQTSINERLIRAWRTGERIPKIGMLRKLAEALGHSYEELQSTWIASMEQKPARSKKAIAPNPFNVNGSSTTQIYEPEDLNERVIRELSQLQIAVISMIESLGKPSRNNNEILIAFQSKNRLFDDVSRERWNIALGDAIKKGWTVHHIIQVSRDLDRILFAVSNLLRFVDNSEKYNLFKFKQKGAPIAAHGMIVIPGKSALICMATKNEDCLDSAIYLNASDDNDQIEAYKDRFELLRKQAELVFKKFDSYQQPQLLAAFSRSDQESGARIVSLKRISEINRPSYFYEFDSDWAKAIQKHFKFTDEELEEHIKTRRKRHEDLIERLNDSGYRYIYYKSCFERFVNEGKAYPFYFEANLQQRLDQLKEIENLLLNSPNFEIALVEEDEEIITNMKPTFCEVKAGVIAIMEVPYHDKKGNFGGHKWFLIEDQTITRAFEEHLSQLWDRLRDSSKDQISVLRWFRQKIQTLEDRIRLSEKANDPELSGIKS